VYLSAPTSRNAIQGDGIGVWVSFAWTGATLRVTASGDPTNDGTLWYTITPLVR
jgi:hypothetical protein